MRGGCCGTRASVCRASGRASRRCSVLDRPPPLQIQTLGRFAVLRDGLPVSLAEWQSKKARDLLKLLVARRGRTAPRDFLIEALWPDEDPKKTSNRLSVALNVARGVLDPLGRWDADRFVAADRDGVRLELANVAVDVEAFLCDTRRRDCASSRPQEAARHNRSSRPPRPRTAESSSKRTATRSGRPRSATKSARRTSRSRGPSPSSGPDTTRYHLRILALDPYDEDTHLDLVARLAATGPARGKPAGRIAATCRDWARSAWSRPRFSIRRPGSGHKQALSRPSSGPKARSAPSAPIPPMEVPHRVSASPSSASPDAPCSSCSWPPSRPARRSPPWASPLCPGRAARRATPSSS